MFLIFTASFAKTTADSKYSISLTSLFSIENLNNIKDETLTNPGNDEFIINYAKYLFCMSDGLEDMGAYYKAQIDNPRQTL